MGLQVYTLNGPKPYTPQLGWGLRFRLSRQRKEPRGWLSWLETREDHPPPGGDFAGPLQVVKTNDYSTCSGKGVGIGIQSLGALVFYIFWFGRLYHRACGFRRLCCAVLEFGHNVSGGWMGSLGEGLGMSRALLGLGVTVPLK